MGAADLAVALPTTGAPVVSSVISLGAGTTGDEFRIAFDITGAPKVSALATTSFTTTETLYNVGALPFLGGMCKLFIPAPGDKIVQVQVAGVHKPAGVSQYPATATVQGSGS